MTKPKSHTITLGDFTLEVGLDESRVLLDLTQLLARLHEYYGQKESEAKYAYVQAEKLAAENKRLRKAIEGASDFIEQRQYDKAQFVLTLALEVK